MKRDSSDTLAFFSGVARRHSITAIVEDAADEQRFRCFTFDRMIGPPFIEIALDSLE